MDNNTSPELTDILHRSVTEALRLGYEFVAPEHIMLAIIQNGNCDAMVALQSVNNIGQEDLRLSIEKSMNTSSPITSDNMNLPFLPSTERVIRFAAIEANAMKKPISSVHLLLALLNEKGTAIRTTLNNMHITYEDIKRAIAPKPRWPKSSLINDDDEDEDSPFASRGNAGSNPSAMQQRPNTQTVNTNSDTPVLDNFGIDLSKAAEENRLDPVIGRTREIERIAQILSRRKKNNPILIGEPGVGKSAIVEGLALRIKEKRVSRVLFDKRVVTLDIASIVAGTKYRGQFEERIKAILGELRKNPNIILFIDEIHTIVGAGSATGSLDAANILKPALARGEIQCIGATTLDEYRQSIEKDGALERRFQKVIVEPTSVDETIQILTNIKDKYEEHHNVTYTPEAIKACVLLTNRYMSERQLPDKAIDALDEAGSRMHISNIVVPPNIVEMEHRIEELDGKKRQAVKDQNFELAASFRDQEKMLTFDLEEAKRHWQNTQSEHREIVTEDNIAEVVAMMTGVPTQRIAQAESERLLQMPQQLKGSVVGQDEAIQKVVRAILRNRAGLKDPNRPIGSFIFLGPTGVGKTHLAQVLAQYLFGSKDALIRVDMSEFMEKFAVSRLVGAPPGYVGYQEGGQLTEKVRRKPYAVVLLDEIEKAHPDVFNLLLQVLDEGHLTDSVGRKIDFKNTIIIMTSNIGSRELKEFGRGVGFAQENRESDEQRANSILNKALKKAFAPEFINRIDDTIIFHELSKDNIMQIVDIELKGLYERIEAMGHTLNITPAAKQFIANKSYDSQYGARPLRRSLQKYVEDELAELIISSEIKGNSQISIDYDEQNDKILTSFEPKILKLQ